MLVVAPALVTSHILLKPITTADVKLTGQTELRDELLVRLEVIVLNEVYGDVAEKVKLFDGLKVLPAWANIIVPFVVAPTALKVRKSSISGWSYPVRDTVPPRVALLGFTVSKYEGYVPDSA